MTSVATTNQPNKQQLPDYRAYPDFFVGPIGLFEICRSAISNDGVYRTAPDTPGLLNISQYFTYMVTLPHTAFPSGLPACSVYIVQDFLSLVIDSCFGWALGFLAIFADSYP